MKFSDYRISEEIKKNLSKLGFKRPTDIQYKAIPNILKGEDVLAIAQTGTGKTAAFAIPVIDILHYNKKSQRRPDGIKCVIMAPTRELVIQLTEVFEQLCQHTRVKVFGLYGGVEQDPQIDRLQKELDILISTPAERVHKAMERVNIESLTIHGDKEQKEREKALNSFRDGTVKLLIATDVSARGIDIPSVDWVINYDLPEQAENYVHRVGRTGRGKLRGKALAFCSTHEKELLEAIHAYIGKPIQVMDIDKVDYASTLEFSEEGKFSSIQNIMEELEGLEKFNKKKKGKKK
ncbi:UNVERIFIED_CONTAM: hypothetical protein GTU68_013437 [Idotea baltica]|nr:hypothetical protein [Idotea baltica]